MTNKEKEIAELRDREIELEKTNEKLREANEKIKGSHAKETRHL